jgi:hypothetical protein
VAGYRVRLMELALTDSQAELLRRILDTTYRDGRAEIADTDQHRYKDALRARNDEVRALLDQLGGPLPNPA